MNKRNIWIATGSLGVMALGMGAAVADSATIPQDLGSSITAKAEASASTPVLERAVSPAEVNVWDQPLTTADSPTSAQTADSPASPVSAQSAPSPVSAQSAPSPVSAQSPATPESAPSPVSSASPASAPSADTAAD